MCLLPSHGKAVVWANTGAQTWKYCVANLQPKFFSEGRGTLPQPLDVVMEEEEQMVEGLAWAGRSLTLT